MIRLENQYASLPHSFFEICQASPLSDPKLCCFNNKLSNELGIDRTLLSDQDWALYLSGNKLFQNSSPLAQAYAGHQFGHFVPQLGDGRALLLGEFRTADGKLFDIQLKGSGPTRFSRRGDGKAALGPMLREYIVSEAMHALGIPTTRSLAVVQTGEDVIRDEVLPGAILTRISKAHIRVGTFEYFASREDLNSLKILADYTIQRLFPELLDQENPYLGLFDQVMQDQAQLISQWMQVGFIHGVMNTDNCSIAGETIDYGPCAFLDEYKLMKVFSSIDRQGRYAYGNQPLIGKWNLSRFGLCLRPLLHSDLEKSEKLILSSLEKYDSYYQKHYLTGFRLKLGLVKDRPEDADLISDFLAKMEAEAADFTGSFSDLINILNQDPPSDWHRRWSDRLRAETASPSEIISRLSKANPSVIPRNHHIEKAIREANNGNFDFFHNLIQQISQPYAPRSQTDKNDLFWAQPPPGGDRIYKTYCGT